MYTGWGGVGGATTTGPVGRGTGWMMTGWEVITSGLGKRPMSTRPYTPGWLITTDTPTSVAWTFVAPHASKAMAAHEAALVFCAARGGWVARLLCAKHGIIKLRWVFSNIGNVANPGRVGGAGAPSKG